MKRLAEVKKAQIAFFVILSVMIVAGIAIIFYLKYVAPIPSKLQPVEDYYLECIGDITYEGAAILGEQGGYIELPSLELGSGYMPSGSQLNFFGSVIPHWFYVSGNNIQKTQIPTLKGMEEQLADYVSDNMDECSFEGFSDYEVSFDRSPQVKAKISDSEITTDVYYPMTIKYGDITKTITKHSVISRNRLGNLFNLAKEIFDTEQSNLFLEQYTIDTIALNAPTTGTELTCSPKIWIAENISSNIKDALQRNIMTLKVKGNYYTLAEKQNAYFVYDLGKDVNEQVGFFYSPKFPTKIEISPEENGLMKAMPVGMQENLGILGLCYVPYHFVYSVSYPVLVQIMDENELFQFSTVVIIDKNMPRNAEIEEQPFEEFEQKLCMDERKIETVSVSTHDINQNPVESEISFKCMNAVCGIGSTENGELTGKFPQCTNGFVIASAENYAPAKQQISTNGPASIDFTLNRFYELDVDLGGIEELNEDEKVFISFSSDDYSTSLIYPGQDTVKLADGVYDVKATLFRQGSIKFEGATKEECIKVPASGIAGIFGVEKEECYDIELPEQNIPEVIAGGGKTKSAISESELESSKSIEIIIPEFNAPSDISELQSIYALVETSDIEVYLR